MARVAYALRLRRMAGLLIFALLIIFAGCALWQVGAEKDVVKNGIRFKEFRETKDGTKMGSLYEDMVIDGWPCKKDFIVFHPDWKLDELRLSRDYERNGIFMPEGTRVFPNANGNPGTCIFPRDIEIQGYVARGSARVEGGFMTRFYNSGRLMLFWSREPVEVDGVVCKNSLFNGIYLHDNGGLRECILAGPALINAVRYSKGTHVRLDESGVVVSHDP